MAIKYHYDIEQGSDEWHRLKLGILSASKASLLVTPTGAISKNKTRHGYACQIAAQRELMRVEDTYQSYDMLRGTIQEGTARDIYDDNYAPVKECGFIVNDFFDIDKPISESMERGVGCSPDGLVGNEGGIEIKSRMAKFQIETIISGEVPKEYLPQIQTFLLVTERQWCDFISYSAGLPLFVKRVYPDKEMHSTILEAAIQFDADVNLILTDYREKSFKLIQTEYINWNVNDEIEGSE